MKKVRGIYSNPQGHWVGDGFPVRSLFDYQGLGKQLSPFLLLDYAGPADFSPAQKPRGVGQHPHRGFETVTYMIAGRMRHQDSSGGAGLLQNGGVQWMTAGRGLIHSEMPEQEEGRMEGFQLWLNLASWQKMCAPAYRDIQSEEVPEVLTPEGVRVRVIAGQSHGTGGAVQRPASDYPSDALYLDLHFSDTQTLAQPLPASHNAFVYVYRGSLEVLGAEGERAVPAQRMAILNNAGDGAR